MTPPDHAELRRIAEAATPGPWTSERQDQDSGEIYHAIHSAHDYAWIVNVSEQPANAAFIAAANPAMVLGLLAEIDALRGKLKKSKYTGPIDEKTALEIADVYTRKSARETADIFGISPQGVLNVVRRLGNRVRSRQEHIKPIRAAQGEK